MDRLTPIRIMPELFIIGAKLGVSELEVRFTVIYITQRFPIIDAVFQPKKIFLCQNIY